MSINPTGHTESKRILLVNNDSFEQLWCRRAACSQLVMPSERAWPSQLALLPEHLDTTVLDGRGILYSNCYLIHYTREICQGHQCYYRSTVELVLLIYSHSRQLSDISRDRLDEDMVPPRLHQLSQKSPVSVMRSSRLPVFRASVLS